MDKKKELNEIKMVGITIGVIAVIVLVVAVMFGSWYTVPAGHRGVLTTMGAVDKNEKPEGFGFKIPIFQSVKDIEVRTQKIEVTSDSSSKDLQDVQTAIALNFHVDPSTTAELYQEIGLDYASRIINPAIEETVKSISATYTAEELITKRTAVRNELHEQLKSRLTKSYIVVDDFNIVNFQFSEEFDKAIEQKVTAEQLKLKAERDLERIKIEKEQIITTAQAEAESIRIQTAALAESNDVLQLRWIEKWDGRMPLVVGNSLPMVDLGLGGTSDSVNSVVIAE